MVDNGRLTVDQKVKVVLFNAETKSVVATQTRFCAHFGTRILPSFLLFYILSILHVTDKVLIICNISDET